MCVDLLKLNLYETAQMFLFYYVLILQEFKVNSLKTIVFKFFFYSI